MGEITAGHTFTSGEKNITHIKLNTLITSAVIGRTFITGQSADAAPDKDASQAVFDNGTGLRRATLNQLIFGSNDLVHAQTAHTAPIKTDEVLVYDATAGANKRMTLANLITGAVGHTAPVGLDVFAVYDITAGAYKKLPLETMIHGATALTAPAGADEVLLYDSDGAEHLKRTTLAELITGLAAAVTVPLKADKLAIYDAANAALKNVTVEKLLFGAGAVAVAAAADVLPWYDADAAVIGTMDCEELWASTHRAARQKAYGSLPAAGATDTDPHGIADVPDDLISADFFLVCATAEGGYALKERVPLDAFYVTSTATPAFNGFIDDTNIGILRSNAAGDTAIYVRNKSDGSAFQVTPGSWTWECVYCHYPM